MANRSYLYSIDFDSTNEERTENNKVCGLSEYNYMIPLVFKIMVSQDSRLSKSIIWDNDKPIAIIGDFLKGREKLFGFLDELLKMDLFDKKELEKRVQETKGYLNDKNHENKYTILECGEIFDMEEGTIDEHNEKLYKEEILKIDETIKKCVNKLKKMEDDEKWEFLGIDYWVNVLYYS
jgi:hypothetical protein